MRSLTRSSFSAVLSLSSSVANILMYSVPCAVPTYKAKKVQEWHHRSCSPLGVCCHTHVYVWHHIYVICLRDIIALYTYMFFIWELWRFAEQCNHLLHQNGIFSSLHDFLLPSLPLNVNYVCHLEAKYRITVFSWQRLLRWVQSGTVKRSILVANCIPIHRNICQN